MIINLQHFGIVVLTGMITVAMAQDLDPKTKLKCGNIKPDEQTLFNREILIRSHKSFWKNLYAKITYYFSDAYKFEPGDAVFCWLPNAGLAKHYALYKGNNLIVHVQNSEVVMTLVENWEQTGCEGPYVLSDYYNVDGLKSVRHAERMIGKKVCYDVNTCNGEHFVTFWMNRNICENQSDRCPNYRCLGQFSKEEIDSLYW